MFVYEQPMNSPKLDDAAAHFNPANAEYSVLRLAHLLWSRKVPILLAGLICAAAAVIVGKSLTPRYAATAQLYVDPRELQLVDRELTPRAQDLSGLGMVVESQAHLITSNHVLLQVIDETKLENDPEFGGPSESFLGSLLSFAGRGRPPVEDASAHRTATLDALNRHIRVKRADRTFIVDIEVWSRDPAKAAMLANAISSTYLAESKQSQATAARRATTDLSARLKELQDRLRTAENNLADYKARNNFVGTQDTLVSDQQLSSSTQRLVAAHALTLDAQAKYDQIENSRVAATDAGAIPEAMQSPTIGNLRAQFAEARRRYADLKSELGPLHPSLRNMEKQVEDLRRNISEEISRFAQSAKNDLTRARDLEASLTKTLNTQKQRSVELGHASVRLRELEREVEASRSVYQSFLKRSRETEEQETLNTSSARIIGEATSPQRRVFPPAMSLLAMVCFMIGALAASAFFAAFGRLGRRHAELPQMQFRSGDKLLALAAPERLPPTKNPYQDKAELPFPNKPILARLQETDVLRPMGGVFGTGALDVARLGWPILRAGPSLTPFLEAMRRMRATAVTRSPGGAATVLAAIGPAGWNDRIIAVLNAALAAARDGAKVLIIDADHVQRSLSDKIGGLQKGDTHTRNWLGFAVKNRPTVELGNGITVLPIMRRPEAKATGKAIAKAIEKARWSRRFDLIIIDGPAMPWNEPERKLLELADGLMAVVPTTLDINDAVEDILTALDGTEAKLIGVVLDELHASDVQSYKHRHYA